MNWKTLAFGIFYLVELTSTLSYARPNATGQDKMALLWTSVKSVRVPKRSSATNFDFKVVASAGQGLISYTIHSGTKSITLE